MSAPLNGGLPERRAARREARRRLLMWRSADENRSAAQALIAGGWYQGDPADEALVQRIFAEAKAALARGELDGAAPRQ